MKGVPKDTIKVSMNINKDIWTKFRIRCLQESKTATAVVEKMITDHIKKATQR